MDNNYGCLSAILKVIGGLLIGIVEALTVKDWLVLLLLTGVVSILVIGGPKLILNIIAKNKKSKLEEDAILSAEYKEDKEKQVENDVEKNHSFVMKTTAIILWIIIICVLIIFVITVGNFFCYIIEELIRNLTLLG